VQRGDHVVTAKNPGDGVPAETRVEPLESGREWSLVRATMRTGAMHQVRAHLAACGHPLIGDALYGAGERSAGGHLLHAMRIRIEGELDVSAGAPAEFVAVFASLRQSER